MKLKDYDWQAQVDVEVEYPDEIIQKFLNFLRRNKHWQEDLEMMYRKFRLFQSALTRYRNEQALKEQAVEIRCTATTKSGERCKRTTGISDGVCVEHRDALVEA